MAARFMSIKIIVIPMMTFIVMTSQLLCCATVKADDMVSMLNSGQAITLELAQPSYSTDIKGAIQQDDKWVQLDRITTYYEFRLEFDTILNISAVAENIGRTGCVQGKSGCIYVDPEGDRNGNTTLSNAFKNKVFVTKYWDNSDTKNSLQKLATMAYTDVNENDSDAIAATLNAYFDLLPDATNPSAFNGSISLTRENFYTMLFKASNSVKQIKTDENFQNEVGGATDETKYAQGEDQYAFLKASNKSLDSSAYKSSISRAEAVYMIVNQYFPNQLAKVTGKENAFKDTKNAGDLSLNAGFRYKDNSNQEVGKDRWQSYTLAYM